MEQACRRAVAEKLPLRDVLLEQPEVDDRLGARGVDAALAPESYLGAASALIDRALAAHRAVAAGGS